MKNQLAPMTEKGIEKTLDLYVQKNLSNFLNFKTLLETKAINWTEEKEHPVYTGYSLLGNTLTQLPPMKIPKLSEILQDLEKYEKRFLSALRPFSETRAIRDHEKLFEQLILLLINCYPTYCKKDKQFKNDTKIAFITFLEDFPLGMITKIIHEWIKSEKEFPLIVDLRWRLKEEMERATKRLKNLEKLIKEAKA